MKPHRDVFAALADPTRRKILEMLRDAGPTNAGDIAVQIDNVSRPGVSRHLRILRECGLVDLSAQGRESVYALNPAPLVQARDGWLATFTQRHISALRALRIRTEGSSDD